MRPTTAMFVSCSSRMTTGDGSKLRCLTILNICKKVTIKKKIGNMYRRLDDGSKLQGNVIFGENTCRVSDYGIIM